MKKFPPHLAQEYIEHLESEVERLSGIESRAKAFRDHRKDYTSGVQWFIRRILESVLDDSHMEPCGNCGKLMKITDRVFQGLLVCPNCELRPCKWCGKPKKRNAQCLRCSEDLWDPS